MQTGKHLLRTQNVSEQNQKHIFVSRTQNSATNVARTGKRGNICVGNNVSLFARAFKGACITAYPLSFGGNVKIQIYFHVRTEPRQPMWQLKHANTGGGNHLPQNEANKTAIFVLCQAKTVQGWRRPGYVCSVTMFLQLYLFDFKMPEFEFIHSFFPCSFILQIHMLTSINPWLLSFLVPRQWYTTVAEYLIIHVRVLSLKIPSFSKLSAQTCCCYTFQAASIIVHGHWRRFFPANR